MHILEVKNLYHNKNKLGFLGITSAFKLIETADDQHDISMFDVISLYPWCNFTGPYAVGRPDSIQLPDPKVHWIHPDHVKYQGLIKVRIIPPKGLYFPIIPMRIPGDKRLLFCICHLCAKNFSKGNNKCFDSYNCPHTNDERAFTATTTTIELKEALRQNYIVTHVYRVWHYKEWSPDLFRGYMRMFLKLKVESSEFPSTIKTQEDKIAFAKEYKERLDIDIDIDKVALNAGLRYTLFIFKVLLFKFRHISKIALNSLWGKFSQRNTLSKTQVFTSCSAYLDKVLDKRNEIQQIIPINKDVIRIAYREKKDFLHENVSPPSYALFIFYFRQHRI